MNNKKNAQRNMIILSLFITLMISFPSFHTVSNQTEENIVLITGFQPFDVYEVNPSELIILELNNTFIQNYTIKGIVLPVDYEEAPQKMKRSISMYQPTLIISLGLAGKSETIRIEKLAVNLRIDPEKQYPILSLQKVNRSGPWFQHATLDDVAMKDKMKNMEIPVELSYSAGFYVCNAILFETLFYEKEQDQSIPTGFLHVPQLDSQYPEGMSLDTMIQAVIAAIQVHLS